MKVTYTYDDTSTLSPIKDIVKVLESYGVLKKTPAETPLSIPLPSAASNGLWTHEYRKDTSGIGFCETCLSDDINDGNHTSDLDRYLNNHLPIESSIESIAREYLTYVDDRKLWNKELKAAVKEYGHDQVLTAFYNWASTQTGSLNRKPVTTFLKNAASYMQIKPMATNPALSRVESEAAYISDNRVFFTGDYRFRLALLVKDHGEISVIEAFKIFFQDVDDKGMPWAARDFLQKAPVMIQAIGRKKQEAAIQQAAIRQAYTAVKPIEEYEQESEL